MARARSSGKNRDRLYSVHPLSVSRVYSWELRLHGPCFHFHGFPPSPAPLYARRRCYPVISFFIRIPILYPGYSLPYSSSVLFRPEPPRLRPFHAPPVVSLKQRPGSPFVAECYWRIYDGPAVSLSRGTNLSRRRVARGTSPRLQRRTGDQELTLSRSLL